MIKRLICKLWGHKFYRIYYKLDTSLDGWSTNFYKIHREKCHRCGEKL